MCSCAVVRTEVNLNGESESADFRENDKQTTQAVTTCLLSWKRDEELIETSLCLTGFFHSKLGFTLTNTNLFNLTLCVH